MKKGLIIFIVSLIVIVLGILTFFAIKENNEIILQGEVEVKEVNVASKVVGRVNEIMVREGQMVKAGDVLMTIETPEIDAKMMQGESGLEIAMAQAKKAERSARIEQIQIAKEKVNQARAGVDLAEKTYKRMKNLHEEGVIPTQKLDESFAMYESAKTNYNAAQSAYKMYLKGAQEEDKEAARANVKRMQGVLAEVNSYNNEKTIKAPISGEISSINPEAGELINAGYPVITISDMSDVWVVFNIKENLLSKIKMGTVLYAKFPAFDNKKIELKVTYISPLGSYATQKATKARGEFDIKTFEIKAVPTEHIDGLRAGMSAIVIWNSIHE